MSSATEAIATKVANKCEFFEKVIVFGSDEKRPFEKGFIFNYSKFTKNIASESFTCEPQNLDTNIALILYSSGTTGLPKGVQLSQKNVMYTCAQYK